ncbi:unnamed protein product [Phytomonas sp. Hart1]|nr:unnamed protein product [Phytomonas sp. Hart1]|eukprot:CCW68521.1 unnamed protein product [Phytomonas sp. isolate Hart1]
MSSLFTKHFLQPIRQNPTLGSVLSTGAAFGFIYWWYSTSIRSTLLQTQNNCHKIAEKTFKECREMVKNVETNWGVDIRSRDAHVRRLEIQNVEQTRSVARLEIAMKTCLAHDHHRETGES